MKLNKLIALRKAYPPYMEVKEGFGYMGIILHEPISDRIQCHICGRLFETLSNHIKSSHYISVKKYKKLFGLKNTTALWNMRLHKKKSEEIKLEYKKYPNKYKNFKNSSRGKAINPPKRNFTMEEMNKKGNCPLQLDDLFNKIMIKNKEIPKIKDIKKSIYASICYRFGSYNRYLEYRGFVNPRKKSVLR